MSSVESPNSDIISSCIIECMFNPDSPELLNQLIMKWDSGQYMTKEEVLTMLNMLDLRLIRVDEKR